MEKELIEKMLKIYEFGAKADFGADAIVVLNGGTPGEYENNPTIIEYEEKGYRFCDANMFGQGCERYEALTFCRKREK
ncbi:MAG: hypothetical protein J5542_09885 [Bacteroidales bacterium]|nr:hypothetical protein [Bacteroidales bacterium]